MGKSADIQTQQDNAKNWLVEYEKGINIFNNHGHITDYSQARQFVLDSGFNKLYIDSTIKYWDIFENAASDTGADEVITFRYQIIDILHNTLLTTNPLALSERKEQFAKQCHEAINKAVQALVPEHSWHQTLDAFRNFIRINCPEKSTSSHAGFTLFSKENDDSDDSDDSDDEKESLLPNSTN